jgi:hypothetical protein
MASFEVAVLALAVVLSPGVTSDLTDFLKVTRTICASLFSKREREREQKKARVVPPTERSACNSFVVVVVVVVVVLVLVLVVVLVCQVNICKVFRSLSLGS